MMIFIGIYLTLFKQEIYKSITSERHYYLRCINAGIGEGLRHSLASVLTPLKRAQQPIGDISNREIVARNRDVLNAVEPRFNADAKLPYTVEASRK
jgi:hypothetical protein